MKFKTNDTFFHAGYQGVVLAPVMTEGVFSGRYDVGWGPANLPMR